MESLFGAVYRFFVSECPGGQRADALANKFVALTVAVAVVFGIPYALEKYNDLKIKVDEVANAARVQLAGDTQHEKSQDDTLAALQQGQRDQDSQILMLNSRVSRLEGASNAHLRR